MTWLDVAGLAVLLVFVAVGARLGSLWAAGCLAGGFVGAYLVDVYALPASEWIGSFPGSWHLAAALLFVVAVSVFAAAGWLASGLLKAVFLGVVDAVVGFATGLVAGLLAIALALFLALPQWPSIETHPAWKKSSLVRPFYRLVEDWMAAERRWPKLKPRAAVDSALDGLHEKARDAARSLPRRLE